MAAVYKFMFKSNVHHDKLKFKKGDGCPENLVEHMLKMQVVMEVPVPVVPTAPTVPAHEKKA